MNGALAQAPLPNPSTTSASPYGTAGFAGPRVYGQVSANGLPVSPYGHGMYSFSFKQSPFYHIEAPVSGLRTCEGKSPPRLLVRPW